MRHDGLSVALVIGKFLPLHRGHELLLRAAAVNCYDVHVVIGVRKDDPWSYDMRARWIQKVLEDIPCRVKIMEVTDDVPEPTYDENGTAQEDWFWDAWISKINRARPREGPSKRTHLFSSDLYGEKLAELLGLKWVPVDPDRELFPISGTKLRKNLFAYWDLLSRPAQEDLAFKVAVVGPESTGKSTLTKQLSAAFEGIAVQEYGRTLSVLRRHEMDREDFEMIVKTQDLMIREATHHKPIVFTDTESFTTRLFAEKYLNIQDLDTVNTEFDLYLVCMPTVPWVQDGERVMGEDNERWEFYRKVEDYLALNEKDYVFIGDHIFDRRTQTAIHVVRKSLLSD